MSLLSDAFASGGFDVLAQAVGSTTLTHTPAGGSGASVAGVWVPATTDRQRNDVGELDEARGVLHLAATTADVTVRSTFTIGGVVYAVERLQPAGAVLTLDLVAYDRKRLGGADTRTKR